MRMITRMVPSDMIYLPLQHQSKHLASSHSNCEAMIGIFRMPHYRGHHLGITELLI